MKKIYFIAAVIFSIISCVPPGKLNEALDANTKLAIKYDSIYKSHKDTVAIIEKTMNGLKNNLQTLNDSISIYRSIALKPIELTKGDLLLHKILKTGVLSEVELNNITSSLNTSTVNDSKLWTALKQNIKTITGNAADLKMGNGFLYVDVSTKLLFKSGKNTLTPKANLTLIQIAKLLNANPNVEVMIEGHTDNKLFKSSAKIDNWDLSVKRSTAIVRVLTNDLGVKPSQLIAAGRSEFIPIVDNKTAENRAINRRTRIVVLPKIDEFYEMIEKEMKKK